MRQRRRLFQRMGYRELANQEAIYIRKVKKQIEEAERVAKEKAETENQQSEVVETEAPCEKVGE